MAKQYNTSVATISKVFEILTAEKKLERKAYSGYYTAKNQRNSDKPKIGFIVNCHLEAIGQKVLKGVQYVTKENNFTLEIADSDFDIKKEYEIIKNMYESGVAGLVLYPNVNFPVDPCYLNNEFRNFPIVVVDMYKPQMNRPHVIFDNYQAAREMVSYLVNKNKNRIAFLKPYNMELYSSVNDRFEGYKRGLKDKGLPFDEKLCPSFELGVSASKIGTESLSNALNQLFKLRYVPDAIIAPHDFTVLNVVNELKKDFPGIANTIEVAGFDNDHFATRIAMLASHGKIKTWKTTNPNFVNMGERATELLLDMLLNNRSCPPTEIVLPCPLISFDSAHNFPSSVMQSAKVS
jgi:LacI family sucrose operon transcriptional repressor